MANKVSTGTGLHDVRDNEPMDLPAELPSGEAALESSWRGIGERCQPGFDQNPFSQETGGLVIPKFPEPDAAGNSQNTT